MFIISSDGRTLGNYVEVSRIGTRILGWVNISEQPRFTELAEFNSESLAQASFEDFVQEFGKAPDKINFIYQIIGVDKIRPINYN